MPEASLPVHKQQACSNRLQNGFDRLAPEDQIAFQGKQAGKACWSRLFYQIQPGNRIHHPIWIQWEDPPAGVSTDHRRFQDHAKPQPAI